ncbi:MAG: biotin transporter BioY [Bacillota bacterium]
MRAKDITLIALLLAVTGILSLISIPLPFSPVPVTGQTLGVMLTGMLLSPRKAGLTMLAYLLLGAAGAPVFAGGTGGISIIAGPTGGYLLGFIPAAIVIAWLRKGELPRQVMAITAGLLCTYVPGTIWLSSVTGLGFQAALALGVLPYLPGDIFKAVISILAAAKLKPAIGGEGSH